jgi:hypothetical protein
MLSGKPIRSLATALAVAGLVMMPAAARAEPAPRWYAGGQLIVGSVEVTLGGTLARLETGGGQTFVDCRVAGRAVLANPSSGGAGIDEITQIRLNACKESPTGSKPYYCIQGGRRIRAAALPWRSHLVRMSSSLVVDEIALTLKERCARGGKKLGTETFEFAPTVANSTLQEEVRRDGEGGGTMTVQAPGGASITAA